MLLLVSEPTTLQLKSKLKSHAVVGLRTNDVEIKITIKKAMPLLVSEPTTL